MKEENGNDSLQGTQTPEELTGFRDRLRERYPDFLPPDETGWEEMYNRFMDDTEAELAVYKEAEGRLTELCQVYPEFGEMIYNMVANKMPFRAAVAKVFSEEDLIPQEGDDDYDAYQKAWGERTEGLKKRATQTQEIEANEAKSIEAIDRFCAEKSLSDEQKEQLTDVINDHFTELLYKRISPEMLEGFLKQMSYDVAIQEAENTGLIRGRNEQIEARRIKERMGMAGDGLPATGGGGSLNPEEKARKRSFFDLPERKGI